MTTMTPFYSLSDLDVQMNNRWYEILIAGNHRFITDFDFDGLLCPCQQPFFLHEKTMMRIRDSGA